MKASKKLLLQLIDGLIQRPTGVGKRYYKKKKKRTRMFKASRINSRNNAKK